MVSREAVFEYQMRLFTELTVSQEYDAEKVVEALSEIVGPAQEYLPGEVVDLLQDALDFAANNEWHEFENSFHEYVLASLRVRPCLS